MPRWRGRADAPVRQKLSVGRGWCNDHGKAAAYCTATQGLSVLSRDERNSISDAQASRNYHMSLLSEELEKGGWIPLVCVVEGEAVYVVPRLRKVVKPFSLEDIMEELGSLSSLPTDSERGITEIVTEHILRNYTEHVPCGGRLTRKVSDQVRDTARPLSQRATLQKVMELDNRIAELRAPFRAQRKPHQKAKRLLEADVMQNLGTREETVLTQSGPFVLRCRTHTRPSKFSVRDIAAAVKDATSHFVEGHSLDDRASASTVHAVQCEEFVDLLKSHLVQSSESAREPETKTKLQCVRG